MNALPRTPDFLVFTGDLTHTTDDAAVRRKRMAEFKEIVSGLKVKTRYYMPGEHDASLDAGKAYQESFGRMHYSFEHNARGSRLVVGLGRQHRRPARASGPARRAHRLRPVNCARRSSRR